MDEVLSVLRYARHYGLCYDYRKENLLCKLKEVDLVDNMAALPELPDFIPLHVEPPTDSKLRLSQKTSKLLISATTPPPMPKWRNLLSDHQKPQLQKLEPPLLSTDHEKDVRRFLPKRDLAAEDIDFPLEMLNEQNDEGLSWPAPIRKVCVQLDREIAHEKLQIPRGSLRLLSCTLRDTWTEDDHKNLVMDLLMFKKKPALEPISPPLMPEDPSSGPFVPSSPALRLALTSDPASLTPLPTESPPRGPSYEDYIQFSQDTPPEAKLLEYYPKYFKHEDDDLIDYDVDERSSFTGTEEKEATDEDTLEHKKENDFISARSFISHISIPDLAPYASGQAQSLPSLPVADSTALLFEDEKLQKRSMTPKPQLHELEASPTKCVAFPEKLEIVIPHVLHGVQIPVNLKLLPENLERDEYKPSIPKNIIRSHQMLWKPEKLPLLKEDDYDEGDWALDFPTDQCKIGDECKFEIKNETSLHLTESSQPTQEAFEEPSHAEVANKEREDLHLLLSVVERPAFPKKRKPLEDIINEAKRQHVVSVGTSSRFSASGSLSSFLGTRHDQTTPHLESNLSEEQVDVLVPETPESITNTKGSGKPNITALESPRTIFFSINHLQSHPSLLRFFEAWAAGTLNIVYRDIEIPMLLSPNHAVIITSLQALTQRPLPGQGSEWNSAIHDQVSVLSRGNSFEVLTVLVSTPPFGPSDQTTALSFAAYCERISRSSACLVRPVYVPPGEADLHSSVAKLVFEHAFHTGGMVFLEDDTIWESFLVKAGMNPFAAQVVVGLLGDDSSGRPNGLGAFVQMSPAERNQRFGSMIGRNVLDRVIKGIKNGFGSGELM